MKIKWIFRPKHMDAKPDDVSNHAINNKSDIDQSKVSANNQSNDSSCSNSDGNEKSAKKKSPRSKKSATISRILSFLTAVFVCAFIHVHNHKESSNELPELKHKNKNFMEGITITPPVIEVTPLSLDFSPSNLNEPVATKSSAPVSTPKSEEEKMQEHLKRVMPGLDTLPGDKIVVYQSAIENAFLDSLLNHNVDLTQICSIKVHDFVKEPSNIE